MGFVCNATLYRAEFDQPFFLPSLFAGCDRFVWCLGGVIIQTFMSIDLPILCIQRQLGLKHQIEVNHVAWVPENLDALVEFRTLLSVARLFRRELDMSLSYST